MKLGQFTTKEAGWWVLVSTSYDKARNELLKAYPGVKWDKSARCWMVPFDVWPRVKKEVFNVG